MYAYPGEDFYANVKAELLPAASYTQQQQTLLDNFDHMVAGGGVSRNYALKPTLHGLPVYGMDRDALEGGVLGVYLLFLPVQHAVVTIYFLNQEPEHRHFKTMGEYAVLRDRFLDSYASCLAGAGSPPK